MTDRERRRIYLFAQSLTYLIAGLFLLSYAYIVEATNLFLALGALLCAFSFLCVIVSVLIHKFLPKMEYLDSIFQILLLVITFFAFIFSLFQTTDKPLFEFRLMIAFAWMLLVIGSIFISGLIKMVKGLLGVRLGNTKRHTYLILRNICIATLIMGFALIIQGISGSDINIKPTTANDWALYPFVYSMIAILCVLPMLILDTDQDDEDDKSE
jgi:hypothetical protein